MNKIFIIVYRRGRHVEIMSEHGNFASAHRELKRIMNVVARPERKYYFISNNTHTKSMLKNIQ